jgi:tripartite-type tricarboxylate transporter receptor subunit TctC
MHIRSTLLAIGAALVICSPAHAQNFPEQPIKLIVPFSPGSSTDTLARIVAQHMSAETKQPVIVDNKPGANGFIGVQAVQSAPPDGYTLLVTTSSTQVINRFLFKKLPYDPVKDLAPVTALSRGWLIMVVNPKFPAATAREFVDAARKSPGKVSFASGTAVTRFAGEMVQQIGNVQMLHVPYKSVPPAINDLLGGQVDTLITDGGTIMPHVRSGKLRALGVTSSKRLAGLPDLPTLEEQGLPGYEMSFWVAVYAPAGTPAPVITRLNDLFAKAAKDPAAAAYFTSSLNEPYLTTPDGLANFQAAETEKWGRIVKAAGVEPE